MDSDTSNLNASLQLARLAHILTVCARSTYQVGGTQVVNPSALRAYNELLHRVTGSVRDHLEGRGGIPMRTILDMLDAFALEYNQAEQIDFALKNIRTSV
jgi:hypothetical protein